MTSITLTPTTPPEASAHWATCDHCGASLDAAQRYCVACGTRQVGVNDPASSYFAEASRRARVQEAPPSTGEQGRWASPAMLAVVLALIPLAAGVGVLVGRGGGGDEQIIDALRMQKAPVVNVTGGGAGTVASEATAPPGDAAGAGDGAAATATEPAGDPASDAQDTSGDAP